MTTGLMLSRLEAAALPALAAPPAGDTPVAEVAVHGKRKNMKIEWKHNVYVHID